MFRWFTYGVRVCAGNLLAGVFFVSGVSAQERVDVLAFGDSLTQGYGLLEQDGFGTLWLAIQIVGIALSVVAYQAVEAGLVDEDTRAFARTGPYYGLVTLQYSGVAMFAGAWIAS